ncbi:OmpA family protein [Rufibacter psychrotolerans]|uniref:OmpA family protein n=1 Tax=Rufibacter psychrotolerans TaxID=2812556 RepID=UPI0019685ED9|nr:OmpA family protein [Rufibacter sp. SYSU D00308]
MKRHLLTVACLLVLGQAYAQQNVEFEKDNFKQNKDGFRDAKKKLDDGDEIFLSKKVDEEYRRVHYRNAIAPYKAAHAFNPHSTTLNYRLGVCYLFSDEKAQAAQYLEAARKLNPAVHPDLGFYLGRAYQVNLDWKKATAEYKKYLATLPTDKNKEKIQVVNQHIRECLSGEQLQQKPILVHFDKLGPEINTDAPEYSPVISADETVMVFTSRRAPEATENDKKKKEEEKTEKAPALHEDLFLSTKVNGQWTPAKNMGQNVNSDKFESAVSLSPDGQRLILYREDDNGDLFESRLKGGEWSKPEALKNLNSNAHEGSAAYSYDGKTVYFVSNRPNGIGKHDIYYSVMDSKGEWGKPVNAGPDLNTPYDEGFVFLLPDGKTLYFSSEGHSSMGGYDIFKSVYENGKWSKPENVGYPVNSPDDDYFLAVGASGRYGYLASNRLEKGQKSTDIFRVTFLGPEKPMVLNAEDDLLASMALRVPQPVQVPVQDLKTPQSLLLYGTIKDAKTNGPTEAKIELIDNLKNEVIATYSSNSQTGKYLLSLPAGKNYGVAIKKEGNLLHSENFDLTAAHAFRKVQKDIQLKAVATGSAVALRNIFFEPEQAKIKPESMPELNQLVEFLKDERSQKVEISGFTDNKGEAAQNLKLSESRAKAVVEYLISKGVNAKRLQAKGFGADQPVASNDTEEGRTQNQRIEVKLLGK